MTETQLAVAPQLRTAREERLVLGWKYPFGLVALSLINVMLRVVTLGIYHFWAKTEVRQRIWSAVRINGEPLAYTGRGIELFIGFVIVIFGIFMPMVIVVAILTAVFGQDSIATNAGIAVSYVLLGVLTGVAIFRAQRYRLMRTRWRGIRGALDGSALAYAWAFAWTGLLIPLTLGWIIPWRTTRLQTMITGNIRFGSQRLSFDARSGTLYGPYAVTWLGSILSFFAFFTITFLILHDKVQAYQKTGIWVPASGQEISQLVLCVVVLLALVALANAWYAARTINHFAGHTHIGKATFRGDIDAAGLIWLTLGNYFIMLVATGCLLGLTLAAHFAATGGWPNAKTLAWLVPVLFIVGPSLPAPIIQARRVGYVVSNLSISGTLPIEAIVQSSARDLRYGEGLAEAFDFDVV